MIQVHKLANPSKQDREAILGCIERFNESSLGFPRGYHSIVLALRVGQDIVGGLWAGIWYSYLYVEVLSVPEQARRHGLGTRLLREAEAEAIQMGCHAAWLDTYSFQALGFYERMGYTVFGTLPNYPPGQSRFFLTKVLCPTAQPYP